MRFMDPLEQSDRDFSRARRRAFLRRIGAYLRRDPGSNQLLSFDEVKGALGPSHRSTWGCARCRSPRSSVASDVTEISTEPSCLPNPTSAPAGGGSTKS